MNLSIFQFVLLALSFFDYKIDCSPLAGQVSFPKLLDSSTPDYHGTMKPYNLDLDYFARFHDFFYHGLIGNNFDRLLDDLVLRIFSYVPDYNSNQLLKLTYSSKRFYRVLGKFLMSRYSKFNYKLFLVLPLEIRLYFGVNYLYDFEKLYSDGLKENYQLNRTEICGLVLVILHLRNQVFISPDDLKFIESIEAGKRIKPATGFISFFEKLVDSILSNDNSQKHFTGDSFQFPFTSAEIWKSLIISYCVAKSNFFGLQAICKLDPSSIYSVFYLITRHFRIISDERVIKLINTVFEYSTNRISALEYLICKSIINQNEFLLTEFIFKWPSTFSTIKAGNNSYHVLFLIASHDLALPELLDCQEIRVDAPLLSLTLFQCYRNGNYRMATDLITRFHPSTFSHHFDPEIIGYIRQILQSERIDFSNLPNDTKITLGMSLASFHFIAPPILAIFKHLMEGRINSIIYNDLSMKRTQLYVDLVDYQACIIS